MSGYSVPSLRLFEDGHWFDSRLERDWAGFVTRTGLRWRREPFAIRSGSGPTTSLNVVARPDFFLPDLAVIFECKPTREMVDANEDKWRRQVDLTGLPVVVSESSPQPHWTGTEVASALFDRMEVLMPPVLWLFRESGPPLQSYFAQCPDCMTWGLLAVSESWVGWLSAVWRDEPDWAPDPSLIDLWLSACPHRPKWSVTSIADGISALFPRTGEARAVGVHQ